MIAADAPQIWLPPSLELAKPAIIRPAEHALLKPGAFRPMTREERRATIAELVRTRRLTFEQAKRAVLFTPVVMWPVAASMVAPAVVTRSTYVNTGSTTSTTAVTLPASLVSGNVILLVVQLGSGAGTLTTPSGWTLLDGPHGTRIQYIFWKVSTGSEGATVSISSSIALALAAIGYQISGVVGAPQISTVATGNSGQPDPGALTPTSLASLSIASTSGGFSSGSTQTVSSYPSGYSNGQVIARPSNPWGWAAGTEKTLSGTASENPGFFTMHTSGFWAAQTIILNSA